MEFDEFAGDRQREIELGHCYVAHVDAEVIGYVSVEPRGRLGQAFLTYLCVPKKHRGKGVATGLIRVVQGRAVGRKLLSSTEQWCVQMQHIFGKLGWTRVGEIRGVNRDGSTEWFYAYTALRPSCRGRRPCASAVDSIGRWAAGSWASFLRGRS